MSYFEMTGMALKWALRKPFTCQYPFAPRDLVPGTRGGLTFNAGSCVYCTVCAKKCPTGALVVNRAQKKWGIDRLLCISCGYCVEVCPKKSLAFEANHAAPTITKDYEYFPARS
jgi:formate hydrogenlyase subunit 6/NADH:ubiquinone oxidoreductase subunit I